MAAETALKNELLEGLHALLGDRVSTSLSVREHHGQDVSFHKGAPPDAVVFCRTTEEVAAVARLCSANATPMVPYGSGTSLEGHIAALKGGVCIDLSGMNEILEVNEADLDCRVQAGVTRKQLSEYVRSSGLFFPIDPGADASLGGMAATRASGTNAVRYGTMRENVLGLTVVTADGRIIRTGGRARKSSAGYDLTRLFVGSEGTLGVITKILLRLIPKPAAKKTMVATFDEMDKAAEAVSAIIAAKIIPCTLEFLDRTTIHCVEDFAKIGLPLDCEALLLMETDGHPAVVADEAKEMERICREQGCRDLRIAKNDAEGVKLASARRSAFSALARMAPTTILEDATVPRSELATMIRFVEEVAKKYRLNIGTFGHMGDGNLHPTFLTDERNKEEMHRVEEAFMEIFDEAIRLGGTITGEHGVGLAKKSFLPSFLGDVQMRVLKELRGVLDPAGILNPGKMFD